MKKRYKLLIGCAVVAAGMVATYHLVNRAPKLPTSSERMVAIMESGKCLMCHSENANLPFYASFPVVGSMMQQNIAKGIAHIDFSEAFEQMRKGEQVDKITINKIEFAINNDLMPLPEFNIMHWGAAINGDEKVMVQEWVAEQRSSHYSNGLAAAEFANEPVQPIPTVAVDSAKVALGVKLFHDTRLSADNTISCASCHGLDKGGVDGKQYSEGVNGKFGGVNAPTVYNSVFNKVQFWDGRAETLALQAAGPPLNPVEMASTSWAQIIDKLQGDKAFTAQFASVYPLGYSEQTITDAIAEFEKTLVTPDCPFDLYLKGDKAAISNDQKMGYELFKANKCATCHGGTNLGGQSFELMGLQADYFADRGLELTEEDNGRFKQTKIDRDKHRFKVPTLRNVTLTEPYYHDGTVETLDQAVDKMMKYQVGKELTPEQKQQMMAFLESLTANIQPTI